MLYLNPKTRYLKVLVSPKPHPLASVVLSVGAQIPALERSGTFVFHCKGHKSQVRVMLFLYEKGRKVVASSLSLLCSLLWSHFPFSDAWILWC